MQRRCSLCVQTVDKQNEIYHQRPFFRKACLDGVSVCQWVRMSTDEIKHYISLHRSELNVCYFDSNDLSMRVVYWVMLHYTDGSFPEAKLKQMLADYEAGEIPLFAGLPKEPEPIKPIEEMWIDRNI